MDFSEFLASESSRQPHYLLIGSPINHSVSPLMHNTALDHHGLKASYHAVGVRNSEISTLIAHFNRLEFLGANITIPYKETLYDAMDTLGMEAAQIGAINTIVKRDGKIVGENTDEYGFRVPIEEYEDELAGERAIIFGTGGATKAICYALREMGIEEIVMVSRRPGQYDERSDIVMCNYENWSAYAEDSAIIINATPLGMVPNTDASPVKDHEAEVLAGKICYDAVYNPRETKFLKQAEDVDGIPIGGLDMLIYQGAKSFKMWTGQEFPLGLIKMKLDDVFPH
ncbi:MAG: shikimate dehydrogenase [Balneola sp.]|jgi:shikimate dehydrogenase|nr:shikimate dehydrogenase [Balneola sp.]MBE79631.1 shikimate dehydrogenase [Balneola sp.]|tara:strand:- start:598 stop:1449 length:852 start_codon:yes stop_codon:yes gene_type:complete